MNKHITDLKINAYINSGAFCPADADESVKKQYLQVIGIEDNGTTVRFNANLAANHLIKHTNIALLNNNELAIYNGFFFEINNADLILKRIIKRLLNCVGNYWNTRREKEVIEALKRIPDFQVENMDYQNIINLRNGVLNLNDLSLNPHSPDYLCSYMLDTEYDSEAGCPKWLDFLNQIFLKDQSLIDLLQEIFGACISNARTSKAAIFYGSGANGKSVVANILEYLCGSNNVAHLGLDRFQSTFGLQSLIGKKLNIATELETGNTKIITSNFKAIVTGDSVQVNIKYQAPLETVLNCKLVFLTNNLPDTADTSNGYIRRLLIVPFNYTVPENQRDVFLTDKLKKEISGILNWSIEGMLRLQKNNCIFTQSPAAQECLKAYQNAINNTSEFFLSCFTKHSDGKLRKSQIYDYYVQYCTLNGESYSNRADFWRSLKSHFADKGEQMQIKRINGIDHLCGYKYNNVHSNTESHIDLNGDISINF